MSDSNTGRRLRFQSTIDTDQPQSYGCPVDDKMQCHSILQGQSAKLLWVMKNVNGQALDLNEDDSAASPGLGYSPTEAEAGFTFMVRMREAANRASSIFEIPVTVVSEDDGLVISDELPQAIASVPGIYTQEWAICDPSDKVVAINKSCMFVSRGMYRDTGVTGHHMPGPPSLQDIRLSLRDYVGENSLLDDVEWDGAEVAQACLRPINYWNELPPRLSIQADTSNFQYQELWLTGIQAYLLKIAEHHYRRGSLAYSAGGIGVQDKAKDPQYGQAAQLAMQEFTSLCQSKKLEHNAYEFNGGIHSEYGSGYLHGDFD